MTPGDHEDENFNVDMLQHEEKKSFPTRDLNTYAFLIYSSRWLDRQGQKSCSFQFFFFFFVILLQYVYVTVYNSIDGT